ncbi:lambda-crystallin [Euwallacea similis]|uniref:lambda-crystallin n=1 Tax=Euwallacea similis TaxID=1736056 RepID=UPI00344B5782
MSCPVPNRKIGIIGSGLIGRSWAMLFASQGYKVHIYDVLPEQIQAALSDIQEQLNTLEKSGLLRGKLTAEQQFACIKGITSLVDTVKDALFIQECVPEKLELKRKVWKGIDDIAGFDTIFSSSTSTFLPSTFSDHLTHKENIIVSHPINPPYYVPLVEIVPAPWTLPKVAKKTREIMEEIGQTPVSFSREIAGFAVNRIQYAILNETWHLVNDGVLDVKDIDKVMSDGLGMRYAFLGILETTHLNAEGFIKYCESYSKTMYSVSSGFKSTPKFEGPQVEEIAKQLEVDTPLDKLKARREWRDKCLTKLSELKKEMDKEWKEICQ